MGWNKGTLKDPNAGRIVGHAIATVRLAPVPVQATMTIHMIKLDLSPSWTIL